MTARLIEFPKARKRGPKVRTGPCAEVLAFPLPTQKGELWKRWLWLQRHGDDWSVEEIGDVDEVIPSCSREGERAERFERALGDAPAREVPALEARLRKRSAVKGWLRELGVDWPQVRNAEDALFSVFDQLSDPRPPSAA